MLKRLGPDGSPRELEAAYAQAEFDRLVADIALPYHSPGDHAMWGRGTGNNPITEEGLPFSEYCKGCQVRRYRDEMRKRLTGRMAQGVLL